MSDTALPPPARRVAFPPNWPARISLLALAGYVVYASSILDITWTRFVAGFGHGARFISRMFPPNVAPDKLELLTGGMIESLQIAIVATVVGVLLALPLGLAAARNLSPWPLAWASRALIALFRTVRATGSPFLSLVIMGVLPQVMPRFIGFAAYQLDSNLRNSALVGLVGGGCIGATLFTAFQRFDYDFVLTIVLAIIAVVMVGEIISGWMRRLFQ